MSSPKFRIQGEVTIYVDYVEEDADTKELALKAAKDWLRREHAHGLAYGDYDIRLTVDEVIEEEVAT